MTDRDPRTILRDAARRRTTAVEAAKAAADAIDAEREARLARERTTPKVAGTPPPEAEEAAT